MNIKKTTENIYQHCDSYVDADLVATVINDNYYMGSNNILELKEYDIEDEDTFSERIEKILKYKHVFLTIGMYVFIPVLNECDIYSKKDYNFKLSQEEFDMYSHEKERMFGILIKKGSDEYIIGSCDLCGCSIDASFVEIKKSNLEFYKKLKEIIDNEIIFWLFSF